MFAVVGAFLAAALVLLAIRYRTGSQLLRQQVKWLALIGVVFVIAIVFVVIGTGLPAAPGTGWLPPRITPGRSALFGIPAAMTVAILRYRLYDIDRIISRTLAYAIVTGVLVGLYAGLVLLATGVLRFHRTVAVAVATLAAAALFSPLRRRVQLGVDRRFNRARYDAEATVTVFAAQLKDTVDLDSLRGHLATAVDRALEPAHVSVWLSERG
jgi:hypothetical protein